MSNCIITSGDAITAGIPIAIGPKGDKGDRGERGPQGLPGDARINDSVVSGIETWSSKKISDLVLSESTIWTELEGTETELTSTKEGYIKGLEIHGNTVKSGDSVQGVGVAVDEGYKIIIVTKNSDKTKESTTELILPQQLNGIGKVKDRLYYDKGYKIEKNFESKLINSEFLKTARFGDSGNPNYIYYGALKDFKHYGEILADKLPTIKEYSSGKGFGVTLANILVFTFPKDNGLTLQQKNQKVLDFLDANNGLNITYELETPTTVATDNLIEAMPTTYNTKTYIEQGEGVKATLRGQYPQDAKQLAQELARENKELKSRLDGIETTLFSLYRLVGINTLEEFEAKDKIQTLEEI